MSSVSELVKGAENEVRKIFNDQVDGGYTYHNIAHTMNVYDSVRELGKETGLSKEEIEDLMIAALFHDTGFTEGPDNHEDRSIIHAREYLTKNQLEPHRINRIEGMILSTRQNFKPENIYQEIIRDADLVGLSDPMYQIESKSLRDELSFIRGEPLSETEWHTMNYQFMKDHSYHSEAAKSLYGKKKKSNIKIIKKILKQQQKPKAGISTSKSAQTQFKTALRNHIDLSAIADNKANIMVTVNALIITVALPTLASLLPIHEFLAVPGAILLAVCVTSLIYAILATRPIHMNGLSTLEDVKSRKSNLFFFGNFYKMKYEEYQKGIQNVLADEEILDTSITRDLFFLGKSLGSKYSRLRKCYNIFMYGIIMVVIAFCVAYLLSRHAT